MNNSQHNTDGDGNCPIHPAGCPAPWAPWPTPPKLERLQAVANEWNKRFPVGTPVNRYRLIKPLREPVRTKTRSEAWVMGGHSVMIMVEGLAGGVLLESVKAVAFPTAFHAPAMTGPVVGGVPCTVPPTFPPMPGEVPGWYKQAIGRTKRTAQRPIASFLDDIPSVTLAERMRQPIGEGWFPPPLTDEQARNLYRMAMDGLTLADALARVEMVLGTFEQVRIALAETLKDPDMHSEHGPASLLHDFLDGWAEHGTPNLPHELDEFQIQAILEIVPPQPA